jgi:hypothetical protein
MAVDRGRHTVTRGRLIAVDGVRGGALAAEARSTLEAVRQRRSGISWWDASGLFDQLAVADDAAGVPSARTLLLLYAADLAFRLRWEIEPILAEGKTVVAAPYVDTAIAFGRAAGLASGWLTNLFQFVRVPDAQRFVAGSRRGARRTRGFVEFASQRSAGSLRGLTERELMARADRHLGQVSRRSKSKNLESHT